MTEPFCLTCADATLGPAAVEEIRRIVDAAPPFRPEQAAKIRAVFESARAIRDPEEPQRKPCGHDRPTGD
jgi:hypothetical protein